MKRNWSSLIAITIATAVTFGPMTAYAAAGDEYAVSRLKSHLHDELGLPQGFDAAMVAHAEGDAAAKQQRETWNLNPNWTEPALCAAMTSSQVMGIRSTFDLGPGFTEADLAQGAGAWRMNQEFKRLQLLPHFTQEALGKALAIDATKWRQQASDLPPGPFSFADLARAEGAKAMQQLAKDYELGNDFDFAQLAKEAGPRATAAFVKQYGFSKGASHAEMEATAGAAEATRYAQDEGLPPNFTSTQLVEIIGAREMAKLRKDLQIPGNVALQDESLTRAYGAEEVRERREKDASLVDMDLPGASIDPSLNEAHFKALGQAECDAIRDKYDLPRGYSEAAYAKAVGDSAVADLRTTYKLRPGFTESELMEKAKGCFQDWYGFGATYCQNGYLR